MSADFYEVWKNKKTEKEYRGLGTVVNATNAEDGQVMVLYRDRGGDQRYVREQKEFLEKFEQCR